MFATIKYVWNVLVCKVHYLKCLTSHIRSGCVDYKYCDICNMDTWLDFFPGVQSAEHNHHQLLRPLSEGGVHSRPGDHQTCGRVWLRLQQRPSSAHLQQHKLRLLPQPLPGAPEPIRRSGAETWCSNHTQSKLEEILILLQ